MELQGFMERQKIPSYFLNVTKLTFFARDTKLSFSMRLMASYFLISHIDSLFLRYADSPSFKSGKFTNDLSMSIIS